MYAEFANKFLNQERFKQRFADALGTKDQVICSHVPDSPYRHRIKFNTFDAYQIGEFNLMPFPANCGTLIIYYTYVKYNYTHKGVGTLLIELQELMAKDMGYTYLIGTVAHTKQPFIESILKKREWLKVDDFINNRSSNPINVWRKNVRNVW